MINTKDQEDLFKLISNYIERDLSCIAIGGTAMMFLNYKNTTKDIDLVFKTSQERQIFIDAIKKLGYVEKSLGLVYDEKRQNISNKPLIYSRGDERFDLFVLDIFGFKIDFDQGKIVEKRDFIKSNKLSVLILPFEYLILLKAITSREKDFEDIESIIDIEKEIDWRFIINEAIKQKQNNDWILIDLEETLQKLKSKYDIKDEFFKLIYDAQDS